MLITSNNSDDHRSIVVSANNTITKKYAAASSSAGGPIQGPAALHDPSDKTSSFLRSMNAKTGSTSIIEDNAGVDDYSFSKNRNAFQRGERRRAGGGGGNEDEMALAPGDFAQEIKRNDYGHERRFIPNYGVVNHDNNEGKEGGGD